MPRRHNLMPNAEHLRILRKGVETWNEWRRMNQNISQPNLSGADLCFSKLSGANLSHTLLQESQLSHADLGFADLSHAWLKKANLYCANLSNTNLARAQFYDAELNCADFTGANLQNTNLQRSSLIRANFKNANLSGCYVYGISAWEVYLEGAKQSDLVISKSGEYITVDDIEVAQFIHLLTDNQKIRQIIDTITSKVVLILGNFTDERKAVLDALRKELHNYDYCPVLFDFSKPINRDLTETVSTLAHLARFIIADITEPRSIPHELATIIPELSIPVQPLLLKGSSGEYGMFQDLKKYPWVLKMYQYHDSKVLIESIGEKVIAPAEALVKELRNRNSGK
jgi:uncharacterized protein YjbI with pentapeptide repeats